MDYKERYMHALEKIREGLQPLPDGAKISGVTRAFLEEVFPELKESEDERIRKALVRFHKSTIDVDGIKGRDIIAWLEKQGEHNETSIAIKNPEAYRIGFADGEAHAKEEMNVWSEDDEEFYNDIIKYFSDLDYSLSNDEDDVINWLKSLKERLS